MTAMLDDADKALLGQCPFDVTHYKSRKPNRAEAARLIRIRRLQSQGYLSGKVKSNDGLMSVMQVWLTDRGRIALGRAPVGTVP